MTCRYFEQEWPGLVVTDGARIQAWFFKRGRSMEMPLCSLVTRGRKKLPDLRKHPCDPLSLGIPGTVNDY
jgi:hypothetical protein